MTARIRLGVFNIISKGMFDVGNGYLIIASERIDF